jgi:DNA polymerase II small subunit
MRERLLARFTGRGTLVQPAALELMLRHADPEGLAERVLSAVPPDRMVLTAADVQGVLDRAGETAGDSPPPERGGPAPAEPGTPSGDREPEPAGVAEAAAPALLPPGGPPSAGSPAPECVPAPGTPAGEHGSPRQGGPQVLRGHPVPGFRVIKDVTGQSTCEGRIEDFIHFFNDRMGRIRRILRNRREMAGAVPIATLRQRRHEREVRFIGMVTDVRRTPHGRITADLDDETGSFRILLPAEERPPINLVKDEVVGVVGKLSSEGDIIWAQSIIRPDMALTREPRRAGRPVCAAFVSDIHVGSKTFLEDRWRRFSAWLNGREKRHQDYARRIEYLVVAGDIVDGIGVYPDQEEDLLIRDVYRQYQVLAEMLKDIPDRVRVLMLPGNHDAVRPAEPQPTFPPEITRLFDSRITFLGNPCQFALEGVEVLAYHGMSIADFISTIPGLSFNTPLEVMKEMLRRRHLAPVYGDKTPLAPESRDWMVVDSIPDIFVTGHVHGAGIENYRGVVLINASTWQSQTGYQKMMNFQPQPARVAVVDLASLEWRTVSFDGQQ